MKECGKCGKEVATRKFMYRLNICDNCYSKEYSDDLVKYSILNGRLSQINKKIDKFSKQVNSQISDLYKRYNQLLEGKQDKG